MLFDSWFGIVRVIVVGTFAYFVLVLSLRLSGKRTLTKLNAFDLIITVALGSTLSSIILSKSVALLEGVVALVLLISLQYVITWSSVRFERVEKLVKAEPTLLLYRGEVLSAVLKRQRVTADEVLAAVRGSGGANLEEIEAVVLETDGSMSVVRRAPDGGGSLAKLVVRPSDAGPLIKASS
jgi:uncharacterized membrane protein YcaP (DUF421 family)